MAKFNIEQDGGGLLFLNENDNPNAPMYNGAIKIDGVQYDIALWEKTFKSGKEGFTVKVTESDGDEAPARTSAPSRGRSSSAPIAAKPKPTRR